MTEKTFKYNMSFYYQSTIIYFVLFIVYLVIRGEFIEDSYKLVTKDPIIYFFALIVIVSIISLLYNLYKNRHIIISNEGIKFSDRFGSRILKTADIAEIKLAHEPGRFRKINSRLIRIKMRSRKRRLAIRLNDYENTIELLNSIREVKKEVENRNV